MSADSRKELEKSSILDVEYLINLFLSESSADQETLDGFPDDLKRFGALFKTYYVHSTTKVKDQFIATLKSKTDRHATFLVEFRSTHNISVADIAKKVLEKKKKNCNPMFEKWWKLKEIKYVARVLMPKDLVHVFTEKYMALQIPVEM
jgi:hypothetical protein